MYSLLTTSQASRMKLSTAVYDIEGNCSTLTPSQISADVASIKSADMQRKGEYNQALALAVAELPSGAELKSDLLSALTYSINADDDYLQWAQQQQAGCSANSPALAAASSADTQASSAKTTFANLWNTVGPNYGEPTVGEGNI
jgi:hypothetical protein